MGAIKTSHTIEIPTKPLKTHSEAGGSGSGFYQVLIPTCYIGQKNIQARLLAPFRTSEMIGTCQSCFRGCSCKIQPASEAIFFHMHGGGFIAQTSKSHETYLRQWSRDSGIPILSIDYSLAPQAPYPRHIVVSRL
jgi:hormone-sensitive lipase